MNYLIGRLLQKGAGFLTRLSKKIHQNTNEKRIALWRLADGDKKLRLNYELTNDSIVFDLGGYEGQWASDIFSKYCCNVYIFEPVKGFFEGISARFSRNPKIKVYNFGLSNENRVDVIYLDENSSSSYKKTNKIEEVCLKKAAEFFESENIERIDLMKINIEGGEYELLEHIIQTGYIHIVDNIQVQFHDFVENADSRMSKIQSDLSRTHFLTWQYRFVWENWSKKN